MKNIFLYPGQGSQSIGMGKDLFEKYSTARDFYSTANDILGFDLASICFEGALDDLKQTRVTQPALYVHSCILTAIFAGNDMEIHAAAGHSLGEYSALQAAGAFSFEDGLRLVKVRAEAMQRAGESNPGAMAALIGLEEDTVRKLCDSVSDAGVAVPANFNSTGQVVVSGDVAAIEKIVATAKSFGARLAKPLVVSGAFHSPLMQPAADVLAKALRQVDISIPRFPVISNVTAEPHTEPDSIRRLLAKQLLSPVRWTGCMNSLSDFEDCRWFEVGSGKVLAGLLKRTINGAAAANIDGVEALNQIKRSAGASA